MRTCHKIPLGLLAALAVGAVPVGAQDVGAAPLPDTTNLALVFVVFPDEGAAQTTMDSFSKTEQSSGSPLESYAVVSRDEHGKLKVQESPKQNEQRTRTEARADNTIDGVVALLGQPSTQSQADTAAGQAGHTGISSANMGKMQDMLAPGTSAIIAVVPEPLAQDVSSGVEKADTTDTGKVVVVEVAPPQQ
ncbi:MAG: hypothetical protein QOH59_1499 [Gemmatimonadales bacterium]|nr:hypothetical protein [Gemmatimonadales bacterium]